MSQHSQKTKQARKISNCFQGTCFVFLYLKFLAVAASSKSNENLFKNDFYVFKVK